MKSFVLNKFRGDPSLLPPAPDELAFLTRVPVDGVLPWLDHGLPDEDGARQGATIGRPVVAVLRYPTASNLDELRAAEQVADVVFATRPDELAGAELVVLPGSKHVAGDLEWLRRSGLAAAVEARARTGGRVLGICGGMQMLGGELSDPAGVDGNAVGLGLLPLATVFRAEKLTRRGRVRLPALEGPWRKLSGLEFDGYDIRHGDSGGNAFASGSVLGLAAHGVFESDATAAALLGAAPSVSLDAVFDGLADAVEEHLDMPRLAALAGVG